MFSTVEPRNCWKIKSKKNYVNSLNVFNNARLKVCSVNITKEWLSYQNKRFDLQLLLLKTRCWHQHLSVHFRIVYLQQVTVAMETAEGWKKKKKSVPSVYPIWLKEKVWRCVERDATTDFTTTAWLFVSFYCILCNCLKGIIVMLIKSYLFLFVIFVTYIYKNILAFVK